MANNMKLFWGSGSMPCWKPMIVLEEKGFSGYNSKLISFDKKEHKGEEVTKLNPRGQVPTFQDGDIVICESGAICDYLEAQYKNKGTQLIPDDPAKKAQTMQRIHEANANLQQKIILDILYYFFRTKEEDRKPDEIKTKNDVAKAELQIWENYLAQTGAYIAGSDFTMADVIFFPFTAYLVRMGLKESCYPNITKYYNMVKDRPSIQASWPPHWKEGDAKMFPFKDL